MGLGYTAILSSKSAQKVITFEKDDNVFEVAKNNPFSRGLFESANIEIRRGDISVEIKNQKDGAFDCIIHDPPTFTMAGELFSGNFYLQLMRVLKDKGKLFHYTPLYKIRRGFDFPSKVKRRLRAAGFRKIDYSQEAGGFKCQK